MVVSVIVQIIFFRCNEYFVERREIIKDFFSCDVLWSSKILSEILVNATSRSHLISLFDLKGKIFHF